MKKESKNTKKYPKVMKSTGLNFLVILAIFLLKTNSVLAQEQDKIHQLSLAEAIRLGLANNYDILIENKTVEQAVLKNNYGNTGLFPKLTATLKGSENTFNNIAAINPFSIIGKIKTNEISPSVDFSWNLLSFMNFKISKKRLEQLEAESRGNADIIIQNNLQSIILGYYVACLEKERLEQFERQLKLSKDKLLLTKSKYDLGSSSTADILLDGTNYLNDSVSFISQKFKCQKTINDLNFLMGQEGSQAIDYVLTDSLTTSLMDLELSDISLKLEKNVDLKKIYLTQSILKMNTRLRKTDRYPTLSLAANYNYRNSLQDVSDWPVNRREIRDKAGNVVDVLSIGNNRNDSWGVNFTVSFNLFDGGKINRAIREAEILENMGTIRIEKMKATVNRDLKNQYEQYQLRKNILRINKVKKEYSSKSLQLSRQEFESGAINSIDHRIFQNNYLKSSLEELEAVYNLIDSKVSIMRITGELLQDFPIMTD